MVKLLGKASKKCLSPIEATLCFNLWLVRFDVEDLLAIGFRDAKVWTYLLKLQYHHSQWLSELRFESQHYFQFLMFPVAHFSYSHLHWILLLHWLHSLHLHWYSNVLSISHCFQWKTEELSARHLYYSLKLHQWTSSERLPQSFTAKKCHHFLSGSGRLQVTVKATYGAP